MAPNGECPEAGLKVLRTRSRTAEPMAGKRASRDDLRHLAAGDHGNPHAVLGPHPATVGKMSGVAIRSLMPDAIRCECVLADGTTHEMELLAEGPSNVFGAFVVL